MVFTWLRDAQGWIAGMTALPFRIGGIDAGALTLGLAWSPMMIGAGALVGLRAAASVLLGAALAWASARRHRRSCRAARQPGAAGVGLVEA